MTQSKEPGNNPVISVGPVGLWNVDMMAFISILLIYALGRYSFDTGVRTLVIFDVLLT